MPLKFKAVAKSEPGVAGGGKKKFYAQSVFSGELDLEELTQRIEKISTVSGADIRAVLYAMVDVIPEALADNRIVRLGDLGSLRLNVSSMGVEKEDALTAESIRGTKIIFTPGSKLKTMQNNVKFSKQS